MVIEKNDGNSDGRGEYVALCGIYTDEDKARERKQELDKTIDEEGYCIDEEDAEFPYYARYMYEIIPVEVNKDIGEFLGGYAE